MPTPPQQRATDEAAIRAHVAAWSRALERRDLDGLMANYDPDVLLFDAIPPVRTRGVAAYRALWEQCLPHFPARFTSEHRDLAVVVDGDLAFVTALHHFVPDDKAHPCGWTWMRVTACFRRREGRWLVVHEHISVPFDPMTNTASFIKDDDVAAMGAN